MRRGHPAATHQPAVIQLTRRACAVDRRWEAALDVSAFGRKAGGILGGTLVARSGVDDGTGRAPVREHLHTRANVNARSAETSAGLLMMAGGPIPSGLIPPPRDALAGLMTQSNGTQSGAAPKSCPHSEPRGAALVRFRHFRGSTRPAAPGDTTAMASVPEPRGRAATHPSDRRRVDVRLSRFGPRRRADLTGVKRTAITAWHRRRRPRAFDAFASRGGGNPRRAGATTRGRHPRIPEGDGRRRERRGRAGRGRCREDTAGRGGGG